MIKLLLIIIFLLGSATYGQNSAPTKDGRPYIPEDSLQNHGWPHDARAAASGTGRIINLRLPTSNEQHLINEIKKYFESSGIFVLAFIDGDSIVHIFQKPSHKGGPLQGASVGKTATAVSAGIAICDNKLTPNTTVREVLPEFGEKDIGSATLHDLLTMSSGGRSPIYLGQIATADERKEMNEGRLSLKRLLLGQWGDANRGILIKDAPGENFQYKSTDPLLVGMMISAAYGSSDGSGFARWLISNLLPRIQANDWAIFGQDKFGYGQADGGIRMTLMDWIRFGVYVQEKRRDQDCLGDFIRSMSTRQKRITTPHGGDMGGYGYFTWTNNKTVPNSYWAQGYGGQFIGWSTENNKMIVMFSTQERASVAYQIAKFWFSTK